MRTLSGTKWEIIEDLKAYNTLFDQFGEPEVLRTVDEVIFAHAESTVSRKQIREEVGSALSQLYEHRVIARQLILWHKT